MNIWLQMNNDLRFYFLSVTFWLHLALFLIKGTVVLVSQGSSLWSLCLIWGITIIQFANKDIILPRAKEPCKTVTMQVSPNFSLLMSYLSRDSRYTCMHSCFDPKAPNSSTYHSITVRAALGNMPDRSVSKHGTGPP